MRRHSIHSPRPIVHCGWLNAWILAQVGAVFFGRRHSFKKKKGNDPVSEHNAHPFSRNICCLTGSGIWPSERRFSGKVRRGLCTLRRRRDRSCLFVCLFVCLLACLLACLLVWFGLVWFVWFGLVVFGLVVFLFVIYLFNTSDVVRARLDSVVIYKPQRLGVKTGICPIEVNFLKQLYTWYLRQCPVRQQIFTLVTSYGN